MSGQRKAPRPVGRGYMPKGGAAAAAAQNDRWRAESVARRAVESEQPHTTPVHAPVPEPVTADARGDVRASARFTGRRTDRIKSAACAVALVASGVVIFTVERGWHG